MKPSLIRVAQVGTTDGEFVASFSAHGLVSLDFPNRRRPVVTGDPSPPQQRSSRRQARRGAPGSVDEAELQRWLRLTGDALRAALAGQRPAALPPLDWSGRTEFQRAIWSALLRIDPGQVRTYAEIAVEAGSPRAFRAVGRACGTNPIPILVPCHRVVGAHGRIGGFSGGLDWKRRLLEREGRSALPSLRVAPRGAAPDPDP